MKKFLYLLTICSIFVVALVGCSNGISQDDYKEIISENNRLSSEIAELETSNEEKSVSESSEGFERKKTRGIHESEFIFPFPAISMNGFDRFDFNVSYDLCVQFITEFQYARTNDEDMDFTKYIVNENLINYMEQSLIAHPYAHGVFAGNEIERTVIVEYAIQEKSGKDRMYLLVGMDTGSVEFIVENIKGRLVISECYIGAKDTIDTICRGRLDVKNDDIYWDDYDEVDLQTVIDAHLSKFENLE